MVSFIQKGRVSCMIMGERDALLGKECKKVPLIAGKTPSLRSVEYILILQTRTD